MLGIGKRQNRLIVCQQGNNFLFLRVHPMVNFVQPDGKLRADFQIGVAGRTQVCCLQGMQAFRDQGFRLTVALSKRVHHHSAPQGSLRGLIA